MTQNHYSQDRTKHLMITFTLFLTYITNFMFKPKITLEFYDSIRIFSYKSQSQGVITHYRKANLHLKNKTLPANQQASPLTLPPPTQVCIGPHVSIPLISDCAALPAYLPEIH